MMTRIWTWTLIDGAVVIVACLHVFVRPIDKMSDVFESPNLGWL